MCSAGPTGNLRKDRRWSKPFLVVVIEALAPNCNYSGAYSGRGGYIARVEP